MVKVIPVGVFAATVVLASGAGVMDTSCPLMELTSVTLLSAVLTVKVAVSVTLTGVVPRAIVAYETDDPDGQVTRGVGARATSSRKSRSCANCIRGPPLKLATTCRSVEWTAIGASGSALMVNVTGTAVFAATLVGIDTIAMCTWGRFSRFTTAAFVRVMLLMNETVSVTISP